MATSTRADTAAHVRALPTFAQTAELIDVSRTWVTRAVKDLEIEAIPWGAREKHLDVAAVLRLGIHARRHGLEAIAGELLDQVERQHPDQTDAVRAEIDAFLDSLPAPDPAEPDEFVTFLREALPPATAEEAIARYRDSIAKLQ